jgi:hypothetical protein
VDDDGDAVTCESYVKLDAVRAVKECALEGGECVFGGDF